MKQYAVTPGLYQEFRFGDKIPGLHLNRLIEDVLRLNGYPTKGCTDCAQPDICDLLSDCSLGGSLPDGEEGAILVFDGTDWVPLDPGNENQILTIIAGVPVWTTSTGLPSGSAGQILYHNGTSWVLLSPGAENSFLRVSGGLPAWVTGNFIPAPASPQSGDLLYYNGTTWTRLARGSNGQFLGVFGTTLTWGPLSFVDDTYPAFASTVIITNISSYNAIPRQTNLGSFRKMHVYGELIPAAAGVTTMQFAGPATRHVIEGFTAQQGGVNLPVTITQVGNVSTASFTVANTNLVDWRFTGTAW